MLSCLSVPLNGNNEESSGLLLSFSYLYSENIEVRNVYSIGQFSKMNRVTIKSLRYYDQVGILLPAYVDQSTGYRYYQSQQMEQLHTIMALRQIGFSIAEIQQTLTQKEAITAHIRLKQHQLQLEKQEIENKLRQATYYLHADAKPNIYLKSLPKVVVASMRLKLDHYNDLFIAYPAMGEKMREQGCVLDDRLYCFQLFHDGEYKETNIDIEICEAVTKKKKDRDGLQFKTFAEVPQAACLFHRGPYETIGDTHAKLHQWLLKSPYTLAEPPREAVIDGIWNEEDHKNWLTEVQFPLKSQE